ncbi:PRC-barrel domain containing protein [Halomicroarcula sp. GCM10025709]|uniref:PRC-barrel domain containing protein n=1 Tax=Haloarcula TaxID=2237 RepID=UPI0024C439F6|nr:PRC-barrel domain containing protein [Halomicroarcula sp. YJ-61-S]
MARTRLTEEDEGKTVVDADGETIGMISGFRGGKAYVDPDPGITDQIMSRLGWENVDEDDYALDSDMVAQISDDEVHLMESA